MSSVCDSLDRVFTTVDRKGPSWTGMWKNANLTGSSKESKKKEFQHLGKKPESAQIHWPSFAAYKT